jgi:hypothetical protein
MERLLEQLLKDKNVTADGRDSLLHLFLNYARNSGRFHEPTWFVLSGHG